MVDHAGKEGRPDWRDPEGYASMLKLDRRAWAAQCVSRDPDFAVAAASVVPASLRILRRDPSIAVGILPRDQRLAAWGLHFRSVLGPSSGDEPCRLAG